MTLYLGHVMRMVWRILSSRFPYSRTALLKSYLQLVAESIRFHLRDQPEDTPMVFQTTSIFNNQIKFRNYGQLLDMFEEIFILKAYEPVNSKTTGLILDCGANIGLSVLYFKLTFPDARIIAFEPHLPTFDLLNQNIVNNGLTGIETRQQALSNQDGITMLYGDPGRTLNMSLDRAYAGYKKTFQQETPTQLLSDFINQSTYLVKLDVEGSELKIAEDLIATQKLSQIQNLIVEYHWNEGLADFRKRICAFGFQSEVRKTHENAKEALLYFWK